MFCSECGTKAVGTGKFCANCGTKLVKPEVPVKDNRTNAVGVVYSADGYNSTRENPSAWFKIGSPFQGKVVSPIEYHKANYQQMVENGKMTQDDAAREIAKDEENYRKGYMNDMFVVVPNVGIVKAPFNCTIGGDSTNDHYILCADNGVTVNIRFNYDDAYDVVETTLRGGDRLNKGDVIYKFDVAKLPRNLPFTVVIDDFCFTEPSPTYTLVNRSSVSFGDTIFDVESEYPAPYERVVAMIAGYDALAVIWEKDNEKLDLEIKQMSSKSDEVFEQSEELNDIDTGKVLAFWDMLDSLSECDDVGKKMLDSIKRHLSANELDKAVEKLNASCENIETQLHILSDYEIANKDDGFTKKRNAIKRDLNERLDKFIGMKQELQQTIVNKHRQGEFWSNIATNPKKAFIGLGASVVKEIIQENASRKK